MTGSAAPGAFQRHWSAEGTLVVHPEFEAPVRALGLPARDAADALFSATPASRGRATTTVATLPGRSVRLRLRPVRHGGLLGGLWGGHILGLSRPIDELRVTEVLRERGAPVPRGILVVGWRVGPLWSAILGTLEIEKARDGVAWLEQSCVQSDRTSVAAAAGRAVRRFHEAGGRHADLHVKNLLVREDGEVFVIDLDKARAGEVPNARRRMLELMRLYRSLVKRGLSKRVGNEGREAFFDAYTGGDASLARALMQHWSRERRRLARHGRGYRKSA